MAWASMLITAWFPATWPSGAGGKLGRQLPMLRRWAAVPKDNVLMHDLDPASVIEAVTGDQRLRPFTGSGMIETMPARRSRRRLLLDQIARAFEPGARYPERRVSLFLRAIYPDYAALRRYLVDEGFLSRADGEYWRSGGTVLSSPGHESRA
jgi:hypothetical protein